MGKNNYRTLRENVGSVIRNKILTQELAPGTRIIEQNLADELGVSRGPIRETLRQLEKEGLVRYTRNAGCRVSEIGLQDIYELYLLRTQYEILSVQLSDAAFTDEELQEMESAVALMTPEKVSNFVDMNETDNRFHSVIAAKCGMRHLYESWDSLSYCGIVVGCYSESSIEHLSLIQQKNHAELLLLCKSGNTQEICRGICRHYMEPVRLLMDEKGLTYRQPAFQF